MLLKRINIGKNYKNKIGAINDNLKNEWKKVEWMKKSSRSGTIQK